MVQFLIQTINNEIVYDFAFHLIEAIKYNNWYYREEKYTYVLSGNILEKDYSDYIPIGSIDFVLSFYKAYHNITNIKPINIPKELNQLKYLRRNVTTIRDLGDVRFGSNKKIFAKSIDNFKDYIEIVQFKDIPLDKDLLISEVIEILSEWRAFVHNGKLLDLRCYSGDFRYFPNVKTVERMIEDYKCSPKAYTLDVAVIDGDINYTALIEVHQFFSCGLYGFSDYKALPSMFVATHRDLLSLK